MRARKPPTPAAPARPVGSGRPYAIAADELRRPEPTTAGSRSEWAWILAALVGVAGFVGYLRVWPAVQQFLYRPSPARSYLLPPSKDPLYVIAGVGVGWFWILFVAAPVLAGALAALWWSGIGWANHRARTGQLAHLRAGQSWPGQQYPMVPAVLLIIAAYLVAAGVLLRWAAPAMQHTVGQLLVAACLAVAAVIVWHSIRLMQARAAVMKQINQITFLVSPLLKWDELRTGRVVATKSCYPRGGAPFPQQIRLQYSQHSLDITEDLLDGLAAAIQEVIGRTYRVQHDDLYKRTLTAVESEVVADDPIGAAESVLIPLVASWFDPAARIEDVVAQAAAGDPAAQDDDTAETNEDVAEQIQQFTVHFSYSPKVASPYQRGRIETMISDALGGVWEAEWSMPSQQVKFVRSPGLPTMVSPPMDFPEVTREAIRKIYKRTVIPIGVDAYGSTIGWDFKLSPHMLVSGATSSGKTSVLMTVATQAARRGMNVVWLDPKGFDSPGMRTHPNVSMVIGGTDEDDLVGHAATLRFITGTMRQRLNTSKANPNRAGDWDPIVVIVDEFSNLMIAFKDLFAAYKSKKEKGEPATVTDVGILLRTARAVGIHLAIGIQRPDVRFIDGEARDNTTFRISMGRLRSKNAALMMFNDPIAGTRIQPGIRGRGTAQLPDGAFREFQAFYTPLVPATDEQYEALSPDERNIVDELRRVDSFWPRRVVDSALRNYDPEDDSEDEMSFERLRQSPIVFAADRPDLDPASDRYIPATPIGGYRQTMDDGEPVYSEPDTEPPRPTTPVAQFGGPIDGFADDYLPEIDDEYGSIELTAANEIEVGDLVDVGLADGTDWRYVHADPYLTEDDEGEARMVIPYRDVDTGLDLGDIEVDPYEMMQVRQLSMTD